MKRPLTFITIIFAISYMITGGVSARIIYVDADAGGGGDGQSWAGAYKYLQDALAAAAAGDEVRVARGVYRPDRQAADPNGTGEREASFQLANGVTIKGGYPGSHAADPDGRDIDKYPTLLSGDLKGNDVTSRAPSDLLNEPNRMENSYHVVTGSFTDPNAVLDGFTITGGQADGGGWPHDNGAGMYSDVGKPTLINCVFWNNAARYYGGGMFNHYSNPTLTNCIFSSNYAKGGGGIQNKNSSATLNHCRFKDNYADEYGGGLRNHSQSNAALTNCIFSGNTARQGGGMYNYASDPTLTNCTFSGNAAHIGGAAYNYNNSSPAIINSIMWGDSPDEIHVHSGTPAVTYSDVEGGWAGRGNINTDPCFVDVLHGDYHLQSEAGRWDPNQLLWVCDPNTSRGIGAGHPGYPLNDEAADPHRLRINMGVYGGTGQASRTPPGWTLRADINNDGIVNLADFTRQAQDWLKGNDKQPGDLNRDGTIDIFDLALLSADWLKQTSWH